MGVFVVRDVANTTTAEFFLEQDGPNVRLCAEDKAGGFWYVVSINSAGQVEKHCNISPTLGLDLDTDGRIVVNEQDDF